ncbi:hypothetical protein AC578_3494 [Pseudocercospora eumusae]|uniref:Uncharacterized protein n=1 Tax=Pseudocercospora eumusae TaxID=321146 RepID=A0A139HR29_9PEZI|nr:hypothetical protein AC578_3494 [Pseudocercospora eumusae]
MARTIYSGQAAHTAEAVRSAVEEQKRVSDLRVAQLEREHHAACLAAYEKYVKFVTEKDDEVAHLQRLNAELMATSAKQVASIERLESSTAQKDAILKQESDLLKEKDVEMRVRDDAIRGLRQTAVDYEITIQRIPRLEANVAEKDRVIKQLQDSRVHSRRAMQEDLARKQDHIEALEDLLAEKEHTQQNTLKLEQVISKKSKTIQEWTKYADRLEDAVRARDGEIKRLEGLVEKHERTTLDGFPRLYFDPPISEERLRELQPRGQTRQFPGGQSRR